MNRKIELLAPAGDIKRGMIALDFGADAIYFGGKAYSLRARASNFNINDIKKMINYAHKLNKKAYIVTNIIAHNAHIKGVIKFIQQLIKAQPDGLLVSDPYIWSTIRKISKSTPLFVSTQQSVTNAKAALFWKRNGATRIVMARETSQQEMVKVINNVQNKIDIEMFVHGAVCIAYSGRCMLSSNFCLRDANNGGCAQSCRWCYELRKNNKKLSNKFTMSAKDMCLIDYMDDIKNMGLASIKIEGRMKSEHYIATIVNAYNKVINKQNTNLFIKDVEKAANRETSYAWFKGNPTTKEMLYHEQQKKVKQIYIGIIDKKISADTYLITSKNYFTTSDIFEVISRNLKDITKIRILKVTDSKGNDLSIVNTPSITLKIKIDKKLDLQTNDQIRITC